MGSQRLHLLLVAAVVLHVASEDPGCFIYSTSTFGWASNVNGMVRAWIPQSLPCYMYSLGGIQSMMAPVGSFSVGARPSCLGVARALVLAQLLTMAAYPNASAIILDERGWAYKCSEGGSWRDFFAGRQPIMTPAEAPDLAACETVKYYQCPRCGHEALADRSVQETKPLMLGALRRLWKLSDSVQRSADLQAAYLASLPKPLIGIHIRAGDKGPEDDRAKRSPSWFQEQEWVHSLQELLDSNGLSSQGAGKGGTCLMFGDDLKALSEAGAALRTSLECTTMLMGGTLQGHHQHDFNKLSRTAACDSTKELILSLEAMSEADVFIGSYVSNIGRLVHLLRILHGKAESTSRDVSKVPIGWHHNFLSVSGGFEGTVRAPM